MGKIVFALEYTALAILEIIYSLSYFFPVCACEYYLCLSGTFYLHLGIPVYIPICVTRYGNRLLPGSDIRLDPLYKDGRPKYGPVKYRPDSAVWRLVHFLESVLFHPCLVWSDGSALDCHAVFFCGFCCIYRDLIVSLITLF